MNAVLAIIAVVLLFSLTILFHELGHFLAARAFGMVTETFSIGFGPAIWRKKRKTVTLQIGAIPFGGYVALPQMDPSERSPEEKGDDPGYPRVGPWKRVAVALAGAAGNFVFAVILATVVYVIGKPSSPREHSCFVGFVETNSAAFAEGVRPGDCVVALNGEPIRSWDELEARVAWAQQAVLTIQRAHQAEAVEVAIPLETTPFGIKVLDGITPMNFCDVGAVFPGSPAEKAGLKVGDRITEFDGQKVWSREHLISLVSAAADREVPIFVIRQRESLVLRVTPRFDPKVGRALIGVGFSMMDLDYTAIVHPTPWAQIRQHAGLIFRFIRALVTPRQAKAAAQGVGGPVAIIVLLWMAVRNSVMLAVWFAGLINVNLAIINLLPLPPLDGAHVLFSVWELVTRKPVNQRVFAGIMNTFFALLFALLVFLSYRDVMRFFFPRQLSESAKPALATNEVRVGEPLSE